MSHQTSSASADHGAAEAEGTAEINAPLVFQCKNCNSIVGDTLSFVVADEQTKTITLSAMSKVECLENRLETSKSGRDVGCTFVPVKCTSCGVILGKVYKTTAKAFDNIRDFFTISTDTISSYGLGSSDQSSVSNGAIDPITPAVMQLIQQQQLSITKMQQMILLLSERINDLEKAQGPKRVAPTTTKDSSSVVSPTATNGATAHLQKKSKP